MRRGFHSLRGSRAPESPGGARRVRLVFLAFVFAIGSILSSVAPVGATLDGTAFELDGNIKHDAATTPPFDWQSLFTVNGSGAVTGRAIAEGTTIGSTTLESSVFAADWATPDASYFSSNGAGVKDINSLANWGCTTLNNPTPKDDLLNAYGAIVKASNGHFIFYAGSERHSNNGDSFAGFWLFQDPTVGCAGTSFAGTHKVGDLLILSNYTNGGGTQDVNVFEVTAVSGTGVPTFTDITDGKVCPQDATISTLKSCAIANSATIGSPWAPGNTAGAEGLTYGLLSSSFVEVGVDLTDILSVGAGGQCRVFTNFMAETRSSQELTATLKDFASAEANFTNCPTPTVSTTASQSSTPLSVGIQGTVSDSATLSGGTAPYNSCSGSTDVNCGKMTFDLYGPTGTGNSAVCNSGDHVLGPYTESVSSSAASTGPHNWTPSASGNYYWVATYLGDNLNDPSAASGCGVGTSAGASGSELITVAAPAIHILKVADATTVNAGDAIGFTIKWWNSGPGTAAGVHMTDSLPSGHTWTLDSTLDHADCTPSSGTVTSLDCSEATLGVGSSSSGFKSVHVSSTATSADCANGVSNTADVSTTNDGTDTSTATITVNCAAIHILKVADNATVNAGDAIGFTIKWWNSGPGTAYGVHMTDSLPAGHTWTLDSTGNAADCTPSSGTVTSLDCSEATLGVGSSSSGFKSVHVSSSVTSADCANGVSNTADVSTTNDGSDTSTANITVNCAAIHILKVADASTVNVGDAIGFTVKWWNSGPGTAYGVHVTDSLPAGHTWTLDSGGNAADCTPSSGTVTSLDCSEATLGVGSSTSGFKSVHVSSTAAEADCASGVSNTADVTTTNDGSDTSTANITVNCAVLSLTKTAADSAPVPAGSPIGFTVTLSNTGAGTAYGVTLSDPLPAVASTDSSFVWSIVSQTAPSGVTCVIDNTSTLNCGSGADGTGTFSLASGDSVVVVITHPTDTGSVAPGSTVTIPNTATATCTNYSGCPLTAPAQEQITQGKVTPTLTTTPSSGSLFVGQTVSDTANLTGGNAPYNTCVTTEDPACGTVSFALYNFGLDPTCSTNLLQGDANFLNLPITNGAAVSPAYTATAGGLFQWVATYSGDDSNNAVTGACGDTTEQFVVTPVQGITSGPSPQPAQTGGVEFALMMLGLPFIALSFLLFVIGRRRRGEGVEEA